MAEFSKPTPETEVYKHEIEGFGEECGVFGVFEPGSNVALTTYDGLVKLKHRGQDASGQVVVNEHGLHLHKELGSVVDVFDDGVALPFVLPEVGRLAIGHNRYGTMKRVDIEKRWHAAQPIVIEDKGFAFAGAYNGDVANIHGVAAAEGLGEDGYVSDTEAVMQLLDIYMARQKEPDLVVALQELLPKLEGAFSGVFTDGQRLIAARDPWGFRPFVYGQTPSGGHVVASEIRALDEADARFAFEIEPGSILAIDETGLSCTRYAIEQTTPCSYEYFYFSKEDNVFHGQEVGGVRKRLGEQLAIEHPITDATVVGVPNSGVTAAISYAEKLALPYSRMLQKNPDKDTDIRSFIAKSQNEREAIAWAKHIVDVSDGVPERVVLVDDSVIRGTVSKINIQKLREVGVQEVHVRVPAPTYEFSCYYGMDTGRSEELLATNRTIEEMRDVIGADSLAFLSPEGVHAATSREIGALCLGCATGSYPTEIPVSVRS